MIEHSRTSPSSATERTTSLATVGPPSSCAGMTTLQRILPLEVPRPRRADRRLWAWIPARGPLSASRRARRHDVPHRSQRDHDKDQDIDRAGESGGTPGRRPILETERRRRKGINVATSRSTSVRHARTSRATTAQARQAFWLGQQRLLVGCTHYQHDVNGPVALCGVVAFMSRLSSKRRRVAGPMAPGAVKGQ